MTALLDAHWSPILAEGTTVSFDWDAASVVASTDLRRIAALLSVQSGEAITERWPPTLVEDDIPFSPGSQTENVPLIEGTDWFDTAWQRITARRDLEGALLAYHEGALLSKEHPSFAFVAFAASIEAIGGLFLKLSKRGTGAKRRFRHALSLVVREPERRNEFEETYKLYRSPTAHIGRLHGREGSSGWVAVGGLFSIPAEVAFDFLLFDIRNLSAALLKRILTGDIEIPPSAPQ